MLSKTVLILAALAPLLATAAPPVEKESHDVAYNSIITQYYTTDPFFAKGGNSIDTFLD